MNVTMNYQILQRDETGHALATLRGKIPTDVPVCKILARAILEDNNMSVVDWTPCKMEKEEWSVDLTLPEGGLYRVEASCLAEENARAEWAPKIFCRYHIGVGDIYVTAGQSNMTGYGRDMAFDPPTLGVHAFSNDDHWDIATHPLADALGSVYTAKENGSGTSPALSFARTLKERLNLPIGIVPAAVGGSPLSEWHPEESATHYRDMLLRLEKVGKVKGILWFQGCSDANADHAEGYYDRFCRMVSLWRESIGEIPLLTVQLNRWVGHDLEEEDRYWGLIRDAQRRAAMDLPQVYLVPSIDLPASDGIHNSSGANVIIGERLAYTALSELYHRPGQTCPTILGAEAVDSEHILLKIDSPRPVYAMDDSGMGMNVEDEKGLISCVKAVAHPQGLRITTARPYTLPAKFHSFWRAQPAAFCPRDVHGMPLPACYNLKIESPKEE